MNAQITRTVPLAVELFGSQWREAIIRAWPEWQIYRDDSGWHCETWYACQSDEDFARTIAIADEAMLGRVCHE